MAIIICEIGCRKTSVLADSKSLPDNPRCCYCGEIAKYKQLVPTSYKPDNESIVDCNQDLNKLVKIDFESIVLPATLIAPL